MLRNTTCFIAVILMASASLFAQNFHVQAAAFADPILRNDPEYFSKKGIDILFEKADQNGIYRYFAGAFNTREEAEVLLRDLQIKGFDHAEIIDVEEQRALCGTPCPYFNKKSIYANDAKLQSTVRNVYFDFGKTSLTMEARQELDKMFKTLKANRKLRLKIMGYADGIGSSQYNIELSMNRARKARNYLISKGIHADRMDLKVFGEAEPQQPNMDIAGKDSPEGRKMNRRVVLALIGDEGEIKSDSEITYKD